MFPPDLLESAAHLIGALRARGSTVTSAESCTGGLLAAAITSVAGSSDVFEQGFITYANRAKVSMIGVDPELLERHGAVSAEVAQAMAEGARRTAGADIAAAITGIAGPGGGTLEKPVGLVFIGISSQHASSQVHRFAFGDIGRQAVRLASVREALGLLNRGIVR